MRKGSLSSAERSRLTVASSRPIAEAPVIAGAAREVDAARIDEDGHQPVPDEFVDPASSVLHRASGGAEKPVQDVHHVISELVFAQRREAANIDEEHRCLGVDTLIVRLAFRGERRAGERLHEARHHDLARRPPLASEANIRRRADGAQRARLGLAERGQRQRMLEDAHAAGRAARPSAADGDMRNAEAAADLEQGRAGRDPDGRSVEIGDDDAARPTAPP